MSRLIDADALMKVLESYKFGAISNEVERAYIKETVMSFVTDLPTAYDVEKVVAELETHKAQYGKLQLAHNDANMVCVYVGKEQAIDCAIDIVKRGGVE